MSLSFDYDVAILGAGPAGSSAATTLARAGHSVCIFEPQPFPRFHIGESMLPMSNQMFKRLGIYEKIKTHGFTQKWGAIFYDENGGNESIYDFSTLGDSLGLFSEPTFQVSRDEFDDLLLQHAVSCGAVLFQERAADLRFDEQGVEVDGATSQGKSRTVRVKAVIDASGRAGVIARRMGIRRVDSELQKAAVYAHFSGVERPDGKHSGSIRIVSNRELDWLWFIPLSAGRMSVGVVMDLKRFQNLKKANLEETLDHYLQHQPYAASIMKNAQRTSQVYAESSFSYTTDSYCGDRWLLAGDAGSFLDPVFSSGVLFALMGGIEAGETMTQALADNRFSAQSFAPYHREQIRRYRFVRRFVEGFYQPHFRDLFFAPKPNFGMVNAVLRVLMGFWNPGRKERVSLSLFLSVAGLQRYLPLVPRLHPRQSPA